jgi:nucleoside-diphosphate-sugar epimerase
VIIKDKERERPTASEVERLVGSIEKIKRLTSWRVRYSLDEGLTETIDWFRKSDNLILYKPDIYNV